MLRQVLWIIFIVGVLTYIYKRLKTENEDNSVLKFIGYYLLGSFKFAFNGLPIPLGFLIILVFLRPNENKKMKRAAAVFGLIMLLVGIIIPHVQEAYYKRDRHVSISSRSIYELDIESDYERIKEELNIEGYCKIEDFRMRFSEKGEIEGLNYTIISRSRGNFVLYDVRYRSNSDKQMYKINPLKVDQWLQYDRLISDYLFFESYRKLNLDELLRNREVGTYSLSCRGDSMFSGFDNYNNYLITDEGIIKLKKSELPEKSYSFLFNETYGDFKKSVKMEFIIPIK